MSLPGQAATAKGPRSAADEARSRFEAIFRSHSRPVLAYALRRVERPEDASDVLAEVMTVAWRRLEDVPAGEEARFWLYAVAQRVIANQGRSRNRRARLGERLRVQLGEAFAGDHAPVHETRAVVRDALRALPAADRELLLLSAWEGLEPTEAAAVLGIAPATARTRLHRARTRLRAQLIAVGYADPDDERQRARPRDLRLPSPTEEGA